MARTIRNQKIDSRTGRAKLPRRREPYWTVLARGCAVGYRHGVNGGSWIARYRTDTGDQRYEAIGGADDATEADGVKTLSFAQAQIAAHHWFEVVRTTEDGGEPRRKGSYLVRNALDDYMDWYRKNRRSISQTTAAVNAFLLPHLGTIPIRKLTRGKIEDWHRSLADQPPRLRSKAQAAPRHAKASSDPDSRRRRQATANRVLTILKAALNRAFEEGRISTDAAWRAVKPFRNADAPRVRYLTAVEARKLVNAAPDAIRDLIRAALLTGMRYGELANLRVEDFEPLGPSVFVRFSKSGKPRHIALTDEGNAFFEQASRARLPSALFFTKADGTPWKQADQHRPMRTASRAVQIIPEVSFHVLRHTYASWLAMAKVPMAVIAQQLGHADTRTVEKHYAHLAPSYVADTVRAAFTDMGLSQPDNVTSIKAIR